MQPVQPVSYVPSGWALVIGGNVGGGQSWNRYEDFPIFDGDGFGGGGSLAARYYAPSGFFIGPEIGVMGLNVNARNPDGAFSNIRWMAFEGLQVGYSFNKPGTTPLNVYFGMVVGFCQRYDKDAGVGTVVAIMLPYVGALFVVWIAILVGWHLLGLPYGP